MGMLLGARRPARTAALGFTTLMLATLLAGCTGDDRGGGQSVTLDVVSAEPTDKAIERAAGVIKVRLSALGLEKTRVTTKGDDEIVVEVATGDELPDDDVLTAPGKLGFHPVAAVVSDADAEPRLTGNQVLEEPEGQFLELGPSALGGDQVTGSKVRHDADWIVSLEFDDDGADAWTRLTGEAACLEDDRRRLAIVLDGKVISAPTLTSDTKCDVGIEGTGTDISGGFDRDSAYELAALTAGEELPIERRKSD